MDSVSPQIKHITLTPSHKAFFRSYGIGVLLSPLLIGFYLLWKTYKRQKSTLYIITDRLITIQEEHHSQNIDLTSIESVKSSDERWGIGTITLQTKSGTFELIGLKNHQRIARAIEAAVQSELRKANVGDRIKNTDIEKNPVNFDRLDYLTGLWQQGLISEEDFRKERRNFESE